LALSPLERPRYCLSIFALTYFLKELVLDPLPFQPWGYEEDQQLLSKDQVTTALVIAKRGKLAVEDRIKFLEGLDEIW